METITSVIALGSNLGESYLILEKAIESLGQIAEISLLKRSQWYKTPPLGPVQPDYLNGCVLCKVRLSPQNLLNKLLTLEAQFGRVRLERWGPRTLDLDIIFYGDRRLCTPTLEIPHPRFAERAFVLVPLAEIAPTWIDPVSQKTVQSLREAVNCKGVRPYQP
jgi:2-amino-4-hydroxy-6-hydroxymethyldihydropteridine diphosphokinase